MAKRTGAVIRLTHDLTQARRAACKLRRRACSGRVGPRRHDTTPTRMSGPTVLRAAGGAAAAHGAYPARGRTGRRAGSGSPAAVPAGMQAPNYAVIRPGREPARSGPRANRVRRQQADTAKRV